MADAMPLVEKVGAVKAETELADHLRREVASLLNRDKLSFPGAQPISFAARHIRELQLQDYWICEKTDGMRYLMYFTRDNRGEEVHYLIDRRNDYYYVPGLHFPVQDDKTFQQFHTHTILDGELVEDTHPDGRTEVKYLVFDCLFVDNKDLMHRSLDKRLAYFKTFILAPYKELYKAFPEEIKHRPFAVEDKATEFAYGIEKMFKAIIPSVKQLHGNDGLIFTCRNTPYKIGTDDHILKWKPPNENTIDFLMHITWPTITPPSDDPDQAPFDDYDAYPTSFDLFVFHGGNNDYRPWAPLHLEPTEWEMLKAKRIPLQDAIVECWLEPMAPPQPPRWRFHRIRDDKQEANHVSTVTSVIESIQDHVTEEDLLAAQPAIRETWKKRQAQEQERAKSQAKEEASRRKREDERRRGSGGNGEAVNGNGHGNGVVGTKRKHDGDE